ncbi:urea ABC transporter ATP-binding subunit UrtE [Phycisphaera mikurensis]|uniref:Putative urea ABC transporter ATP-binding protein n=1 Tax=Phycisphaera mikurensis (strain NBRC 102666 / KCTC 22515 / FYK2301M01) TaxID=1142394 RepID=I0IDP4_PHYMF|nr:urea ABC transporter ATP-binding subunit UrtE [Phycisphaera mikurensis]MBB6441199.1 urea transport system ATP-binding protein [Phycisphaera mikurensis]BAM03382.1 putative urea ABC transporter ATP-binding protein [Phycisphaera mikurensis NBRC 102666]
MLEATDIDFSYGGVRALSGVSLAARAGEILCVTGRNGVGKTTLMRCVMGLEKAAGGSVTLDGVDVTKLAAEKRAAAGVALVPQGRMIFPKLTVEENLRIGLQARRDGVKKIPAEIYDTFPILRDFLKRKGGDLSGGQQQQLAIGRAMAGGPKAMLLDEPTEGIQPNIIQEIGRVLQRLAAGGMAVVLVEQYLDFVKEIGDRVAVMNRGSVVASGDMSVLTPELEREYLGV